MTADTLKVDNRKVDTLIIGSGVAAAALAQRLLTLDPKASILMLEAGGSVKMKDAALWENYVVSGKLPYDPFQDDDYPERGKKGENISLGGTVMGLSGSRVFTLGGTTIHWDGWSFRLKPEDFRLHSNTGQGIDWPISYAELEPYYGQAECYIGVSGDARDAGVPRSTPYPFPAFPLTLEDQPVAAAMESLGISVSHMPIARHGITETTSTHAPCQTTGTCLYCPFGARYSANNFLNDMVAWNSYPNFEIRTNCFVREITMSGRQRASGAVYHDRGLGKDVAVEAERVIIAAGTLESPKLLQRSRSVHWRDGIGNDRDLVGRYLITQPYFAFSANIASNPARLQPEMAFATLCSRYYDSEEQQARGKFVIGNPPSAPAVDLAGQMRAGRRRAEIDSYVEGSQQLQLIGQIEIVGDWKDRVSNYGRMNSMGMIQTAVDFTKPATFDARCDEVRAYINRIFAAMPATPADNPFVSWRADHACCTCRMSVDDSQGVIDRDLKVHGVDNVYVCSNAAFSSSGSVNPTLTVTALALRLGDHLGNGRPGHVLHTPHPTAKASAAP
jgi:choline dehydrogenase-like flavoprotein